MKKQFLQKNDSHKTSFKKTLCTKYLCKAIHSNFLCKTFYKKITHKTLQQALKKNKKSKPFQNLIQELGKIACFSSIATQQLRFLQDFLAGQHRNLIPVPYKMQKADRQSPLEVHKNQHFQLLELQ